MFWLVRVSAKPLPCTTALLCFHIQPPSIIQGPKKTADICRYFVFVFVFGGGFLLILMVEYPPPKALLDSGPYMNRKLEVGASTRTVVPSLARPDWGSDGMPSQRCRKLGSGVPYFQSFCVGTCSSKEPGFRF